MYLRMIAETDARSIGECDSRPSGKSLFGTCTLRAHSDTDNSSVKYKMIYALQYSTDRLRICICICIGLLCIFTIENQTAIVCSADTTDACVLSEVRLSSKLLHTHHEFAFCKFQGEGWESLD